MGSKTDSTSQSLRPLGIKLGDLGSRRRICSELPSMQENKGLGVYNVVIIGSPCDAGGGTCWRSAARVCAGNETSQRPQPACCDSRLSYLCRVVTKGWRSVQQDAPDSALEKRFYLTLPAFQARNKRENAYGVW